MSLLWTRHHLHRVLRETMGKLGEQKDEDCKRGIFGIVTGCQIETDRRCTDIGHFVEKRQCLDFGPEG